MYTRPSCRRVGKVDEEGIAVADGLPGGASLRYTLFGARTHENDGRCSLVFTGGGISGIEDAEYFRDVAMHYARLGFRCLLHDRRNSGGSLIVLPDSNDQRSASEIYADDTYHLCNRLGLLPAIFIGLSSGARLSLLLSCRYPGAVAGLVLVNMTGGPTAALSLAQYYYDDNADIVEGAVTNGRDPIAALLTRSAQFRAAAAKRPENAEVLIRLGPKAFCRAMRFWSQRMRESQDTARFPVVGVDAELIGRRCKANTLVVHTLGPGVGDGMHTRAVSARLAALLAKRPAGSNGARPFVELIETMGDTECFMKAVSKFVKSNAFDVVRCALDGLREIESVRDPKLKLPEPWPNRY